MVIAVSEHAFKRVKKRVHKNVQKAAEEAFELGFEKSDLTGKLRDHVHWLEANAPSPEHRLYKVWLSYVYVFSGDVTLVTVLHLPHKFVKLATKLSQERKAKVAEIKDELSNE